MVEREETIKLISHRVGGIVFETEEDLDIWVNMDKSKASELKEKIQELQKGDKVKVDGYDKDGKFYYTNIEKVEEAKGESFEQPEEIPMGEE